MITLRPYQAEAKEAAYRHLRTRDDNPCLVIPTGGGKTPIIADICRDAVLQWNGRVLILAHVKELLQQAADKLTAVCPEVPVGVYSAGLKRRDHDAPVVVAGIQSVHERACELGLFNLVLVDEAHLIPLAGEGRYRRFLADARVVNPNLRIVGFTATPFRLKCGPICTPDGFLNHICYEVGVRELICDGYLSPLITKAPQDQTDFDSLAVRGGEFVAREAEALMDGEQLVQAACGEIVAYTLDRRAVLIFAAGVRHGRHLVEVLKHEHGLECGFIDGKTRGAEREEVIERFRAGELKYLANCNCLTTGFDAPHTDCVALVRPTASPGLYYQMVGRGFRLAPGKKNCLVLDFGGNVLRHGPVDALGVDAFARQEAKPKAKRCPVCREVIVAGYECCPSCGHPFEQRARKETRHDAQASDAGILSQEIVDEEFEVHDVRYRVHTKKDAPEGHPQSLRVDYLVGLADWRSEYICVEHEGYARQKAETWWRARSPDTVPDTAERAVELAEAGALALTLRITIRRVVGERFDQIVDYALSSLPEPVAKPWGNYRDEEIPF